MSITYRLPRQFKPKPDAMDGIRRWDVNMRQPYDTGTKRLAYRKRNVRASDRSREGYPAEKVRLQGSAKVSTSLIDLSLPGGGAGARKPSVIKRGHFRYLRTWILGAVLVFLVLIVVTGGIFATVGYWKLHRVFTGNAVTAVALRKDVDPGLLKAEGAGRVNILLLGNGGGMHDAPDLTDTMILASVDPVNHRADLVSVPRDLWVDVSGYGKMKINAAYETGKYAYSHKIDSSNADHQAVNAGLSLADQTVERVLGITINYNVLVDFQAFRQAIDTVGGVTISVPTELYDPTMAWENHWNPVLAMPGVQALDGVHALIYVRSRETTSDFARSERQRAVLVALKDKVLTLGTLSNPLKISQLIGAFGDNVQTDLSLDNMTHLASIGRAISNTDVKSVGLADSPNSFVATDHVGPQSVVRPRAGFFKYTDIQNYLRSVLVDGYIVKENARILVLNGTNKLGLAQAKADDLKIYGYNIVGARDVSVPVRHTTLLIDLSRGKDKYTAHYLQQRFGASMVSTFPGKTIQTGQADFIIILGNDETFSSPD